MLQNTIGFVAEKQRIILQKTRFVYFPQRKKMAIKNVKNCTVWIFVHNFCFASKHQAFISWVVKLIFCGRQLMIWHQNWSNMAKKAKKTISFDAQIINWPLRNISFATHVMNVWCFIAKQKLWNSGFLHCCNNCICCIATVFVNFEFV